MYAAYYSNPFGGDDDATCYAEIDMNDDATAGDGARTRSASQQPQPQHAAAATSVSAMNVERLQRQLDEREAQHRATTAEYASHVEALRQQLERLGAENNALYEERSRLETQVRALTLEKDNAEWVNHQEKERNDVLQRRVAELEVELERTRARAQEMVRDLAHNYEHTASAATAQAATPRRGGSGSGSATPRSDNKANVAPTLAQQPPPRQQQQQTPTTLPRAATTTTTPRVPAAMTDDDRAEQRRRERALVEQLEAQLQTHNQRRDELAGELQRLEGARRRSAADRARRDAVEEALAHTQQAIGRIKLQLRTHASLVK